MKITLKINLPDNFRHQDFLSFHQRDAQMLAESWDEKNLFKGIMWDTMPACLQFNFSKGKQLQLSLEIDSGPKKVDEGKTRQRLQKTASHMLGLNQSTNEFETFAATIPALKNLVASQSGLRVPQSASPFEALSWAITGQQISLGAAISLRRKMIQRAGIKHSSGIICYPGPEQILKLNQTDLRECSFSHTKATTLLNLAQLIQSDALPLQRWLDDHLSDKPLVAEQIYNQLIEVRGIGPWTIHYALLRGFGWLDGSLHGDVAVRRNLQKLLVAQKNFTGTEKISAEQTQDWLADFSPWRALVAAHLWAMQKNDGY